MYKRIAQLLVAAIFSTACIGADIDEVVDSDWKKSLSAAEAQRLFSEVKASLNASYPGSCSGPSAGEQSTYRLLLQAATWRNVRKFGVPPKHRNSGDFALLLETKIEAKYGASTSITVIDIDLSSSKTCLRYRLMGFTTGYELDRP